MIWKALVAGIVLGTSPLSTVQETVLAARPVSEAQLLIQLNGEARRWVMPDGGQSGMFGSGVQCLPIDGGEILKGIPSADIHLCIQPLDGGCNTTVTDPNYGDLQLANQAFWISTQNSTKRICQIPASGSANTVIFNMK